MKKRNFLFRKKEEVTIPMAKFITGILVGLLFAFWLYSFLYMSREVFRFFSRSESFDLLILSETEVFFYNLFFALISVIFGQSICFNYWFDKPRAIFNRRTWKKISIVNDNRVLNWYFISWFSKLSVVYGVFFCLTYRGGNKYFNFFPDYTYLFILVVIVLYLQTWNTFRVMFGKESKKWLFISVLAVSLVALIFSKINFIDHKTLDEKFLKNNVYVKYNLEIPDSDFYKFGVERLFLTENIYIVMTGENNIKSKPQIIFNHRQLAIDEVGGIVNDWLLSRHPGEGFMIDVRLHIDKAVPMAFVDDFKAELSKHGMRRLSYVIVPTDKEVEKGLRYYYSISTFLPSPVHDLRVFADSVKRKNKATNVISLNIEKHGKFILNGRSVEKSKLGESLEEELNQDYNSIFIIYYAPNTIYSDYIWGVSQIKKSISNVRDFLARNEFGISFDEMHFLPEYSEFREKYTFHIIDYGEN